MEIFSVILEESELIGTCDRTRPCMTLHDAGVVYTIFGIFRFLSGIIFTMRKLLECVCNLDKLPGPGDGRDRENTQTAMHWRLA